MFVKDTVLIITVLGIMAFGFFLVKRLDKFTNSNRKLTENQKGSEGKSCVFITSELTDEELIGRIREYEDSHDTANIAIYQSEDELYEEVFYNKQ